LAELTPVAFAATSVPTADQIERAEEFARERFVLPGEDAVEVLTPGSHRRRAFDAALREIDAGLSHPSTEWARAWSLLLGLERLLSEEEPRLADGTLLNPHQVDALSGTFAALLAESAVEGATQAAAEPVLAVEDDVEVFDFDDDASQSDASSTDEDDDLPDQDEEPTDSAEVPLDEDQLEEAPEDPNAAKRFWFEHATGAGKTVAAMGFVDATRTGGVLILTHRRNLVDQFMGELRERGYAHRATGALLADDPVHREHAEGPVTVETYQWFVRNAGRISSKYTVVICDEAHTALGEKTAAAIRNWTGPVFIGMTATGALIARHVTDLFPTQTSRFDLAQAARRGVIAPLRCVRIPPGPGVRTIAKVPLRRGEVDTEFDQEMLAELLDQMPFNMAIADLYKTRFNGVPGVVYAAGVRHAYNVAEAFRDAGLKAQGVSGETPKRELATILARYERGDIDVLVNAQLLAEGWNSPRATVCMHLAPTASKRIYQQRVGRVTRRHLGKEAGIVVDFVHPATKHDDPVVTLHSLLDRDVYRGGAIVVGPVRRGRGRRVRVERRVLPVTDDENRRIEVFERELWRIAVEHLDYGEQVQWAALAGARVAPSGWRRARAMLHFDRTGELKRAFLLTAVRRNKNSQLRIKALQEIAASRDPEAFDQALDVVGGWQRDERREGSKVMLQALVEKRIGRRDQATAWIWRIASYTSELHEEYAVQRWPETKRLLGLLVNSSGGAHARNARRLVHSTRKQDRRLSAALLAAARAHTPEAEEVLRGARTRMARKPGALSRELLRNFPRGAKGRRGKRRKRKGGEEEGVVLETAVLNGTALQPDDIEETVAAESAPAVSEDETLERIREAARALASARGDEIPAEEPVAEAAPDDEAAPPSKPRRRRVMIDDDGQPAVASDADALAKPKRTRRPRSRKPAEKVVAAEQPETTAETTAETEEAPKPARTRRPRAKKAAEPEVEATTAAEEAPAEEKPKRTRRAPAKKKPAESPEPEAQTPKPKRARRAPAKKAVEAEAETPAAEPEAKPKRTRARRVKPADDSPEAEKPKPVRRTRKTQPPETEAA
jgi:ribonuclease E